MPVFGGILLTKPATRIVSRDFGSPMHIRFTSGWLHMPDAQLSTYAQRLDGVV